MGRVSYYIYVVFSGLWCCAVGVYVCDCCKSTFHYCPNCGNFLGSFDWLFFILRLGFLYWIWQLEWPLFIYNWVLLIKHFLTCICWNYIRNNQSSGWLISVRKKYGSTHNGFKHYLASTPEPIFMIHVLRYKGTGMSIILKKKNILF